jgi:thioredoxin 1
MLELNESNFAENTKEGLVLIDFSACWCGPCRALAPLLEKVKDAKVVKVNVDENPTLATKYSVSALPTLVLLKNSEEVYRMIGVQTLTKIQTEIDAQKGQYGTR